MGNRSVSFDFASVGIDDLRTAGLPVVSRIDLSDRCVAAQVGQVVLIEEGSASKRISADEL